MEKSAKHTPDIVIFGAGIAGLWTFHSLRKKGFDVILFEKEAIGCGQTLASQGIIHSGLKFSLAGKINKLARSISAMPQIWKDALNGKGEVDLSSAKISAQSQQLLIPSGFMGGLTKLVAEKALGNSVHAVPEKDWPIELKNSGFKGSLVFMDEPVLNIPSVIRALSEPFKQSIYKITEEQANNPFEFLSEQNIEPKLTIFTSAGSNYKIAEKNNHNKGLETQKRPLKQGIIKNAPFPLFAHLVGKTDKPIASITTHETSNGELVWYLGGGVAEREKSAADEDIYHAMIKAFSNYLPNINLTNIEWSTLPIDRIEGKSKTESWMPDTPTIHHTEHALYCWPTKLTFAPMLGQMIIEECNKRQIKPSNNQTTLNLPLADYAQTPWDKAKWKKPL